MKTELVYVPLEDAKLAALLEASEALNVPLEELIQEAVAEFPDERHGL